MTLKLIAAATLALGLAACEEHDDDMMMDDSMMMEDSMMESES